MPRYHCPLCAIDFEATQTPAGNCPKCASYSNRSPKDEAPPVPPPPPPPAPAAPRPDPPRRISPREDGRRSRLLLVRESAVRQPRSCRAAPRGAQAEFGSPEDRLGTHDDGVRAG